MTGQPWHLGRIAALDFECSDKDPETARIVTCALIGLGGDAETDTREWLVNPGVPMEPGAIAVHGITDEYAVVNGGDAETDVREIAGYVADYVRAGTPLVGHNIGFDLCLLDRECRRHGLGSLEQVCGQPLTRVLDTMVIDRHTAPFRRRVSPTQGPYQMRTTAETYGLSWDEEQAHAAEYDALQSARVAWLMGDIAHREPSARPQWVRNLRDGGARFNLLAGVTFEGLFALQQDWHRVWAQDFEAYLRKSDASAVIDRSWPLRPLTEQVAS
ncbi:MAG TPA: exonuclease domain-containing protein [Nocardioides sp.]|nr:exonuclease domain-containing protein [Nocardioides sp.]